MGNGEPLSSTHRVRKAVDITLGAAVMGTVGALIGFLIGHHAVPVGTAVGILLGTAVGMFGGRRFLVSILIGTALGGALAWLLAGFDKISYGAGAGAAMGGFLGVQVSMLLDIRAERKRQAAQVDSNT